MQSLTALHGRPRGHIQLHQRVSGPGYAVDLDGLSAAEPAGLFELDWPRLPSQRDRSPIYFHKGKFPDDVRVVKFYWAKEH